ncbi:MAG: prepilin-type N-terminal cleavage/methylation domain-containing protein [Candidatus Omnitrophica bacterium]|nr:prepilin-type N-terminal cleavage/methylation domain-containing protein [Candidatus Omnitrophota bacterium]
MMRRKGFTLVEIMIVVAIIGLLAAIAIPNFIQARTKAQTNTCIANLKQIDGAISLWALDNGKGNADTVTVANLVPTYIKATPYCPLDTAKAGYTLTTVGASPACPSDPTNHKLP